METPEPLDFLKLLKKLPSFEPHCLWRGKRGAMWGIHLQGHRVEFPEAQNSKEIWFLNLKGKPAEVDTPEGTVKVDEGQWVKFPKGIGPAGLRSENAFLVWMA